MISTKNPLGSGVPADSSSATVASSAELEKSATPGKARATRKSASAPVTPQSLLDPKDQRVGQMIDESLALGRDYPVYAVVQSASGKTESHNLGQHDLVQLGLWMDTFKDAVAIQFVHVHQHGRPEPSENDLYFAATASEFLRAKSPQTQVLHSIVAAKESSDQAPAIRMYESGRTQSGQSKRLVSDARRSVAAMLKDPTFIMPVAQKFNEAKQISALAKKYHIETWELGEAVEQYKQSCGRRNDANLDYWELEQLARDVADAKKYSKY